MDSFFTPFKNSGLLKIFLTIIISFFTVVLNAQVEKTSDLYKILQSKDSILFEHAFNKCEVKKLEPLIAKNFEFYHDITGIQNRKQFINAIKNNVCKNPENNKRNLVFGTLEVFPLKNNGILYGAIQHGKHTFQEKQNGVFKTVGIADFTHVWILEKNQWKLKRVLSFNHLPYSI
jgi:hypothetical protein